MLVHAAFAGRWPFVSPPTNDSQPSCTVTSVNNRGMNLSPLKTHNFQFVYGAIFVLLLIESNIYILSKIIILWKKIEVIF